jgi:hypothetical protein
MSRLASATHSSDPPPALRRPSFGTENDAKRKERNPRTKRAAGTKKTALFDIAKMETMRAGRG